MLFRSGDHTVKDLTEIVGQSQPRVSRHLKLLADAGLVERHAEGAWAYYSLAGSGPGGELARWLVASTTSGASLEADRMRQLALRAAQQAEADSYFGQVARNWDQWRSLHVPESAVEDAVVAEMAERRVDLLVDLGTGTGRMLELLADRYRRGIGIDSNREMLGVARANLVRAGVSHAQVRLGDIADIGEAGALADVFVLHQVLHYFDDPGRILARVRPGLAPRGEILVVDFAPHDLEFLRTEHAHRRLGISPAQMEAWASANQLAVRSFKSFPSHTGAGGLTICLWRLGDTSLSEE